MKKHFLGLIFIVFTVSACMPSVRVPVIDVVRSCLLEVVAEGATKEAFSNCINTGGLILTESILESLKKELLNFTEDALGRVTGVLLDSGPAAPAAPTGAADKEVIVGQIVEEIKTISEE